MKGTDIAYISGLHGPGIGWGKFYPDNLTADSEPNTDEWGPDNYWSEQTYIDWFNLNRQRYGLTTARNKMLAAIDMWSGWGGAEIEYCYNRNFTNFFLAYGIDVQTPQCRLINSGTDVLGDVGDTISSTTSFIKTFTPFLLIGGAIILADMFLVPIYEKHKRKK